MSRKTKAKISKSLKTRVWNTYIGEEKGYFVCICKSKVYQSNFECAHVTAEASGGVTDLGNLRPLCSSCNKSVGTQNLFRFIRKMGLDPSQFYCGEIPTEEEIGEEVIDETSYKGLQVRATKIGIKANLSKEILEELFLILDGGGTIDFSFYRKEIKEEKEELARLKSTKIKYLAERLLDRALALSMESKEK